MAAVVAALGEFEQDCCPRFSAEKCDRNWKVMNLKRNKKSGATQSINLTWAPGLLLFLPSD